jgi:predicted transcriptional regulator
MGVLWQHSPATVAEVQARLEPVLAYTTVLTLLRTLESKGRVGHIRGEGLAHRYYPLVNQSTAGRDALRWLLARFFGQSPTALLAVLLDDSGVSVRELQQVLTRSTRLDSE